MNAKTHAFGGLMTRRVEAVEIPGITDIEGGPRLEIREGSLGEVKPIMDKLADMPPEELFFRLLGLSLYVDGVQLTYEGVLELPMHVVTELQKLVDKIYSVYGLVTPKGVDGEKDVDSVGEFDTGSMTPPEPPINSPTASTEPSPK